MTAAIGRRHVLAVIAGAAGSALGAGGAAARTTTPLVWRGSAMGAEASIVLAGGERDAARAALGACQAEIDRLEDIFSLFRAHSALSHLNRTGRLVPAPPELCQVLRIAAAVHRLSGGAFDVTVQPLWRLHAEHFAGGTDRPGPSEAAIARVLERVGQGARLRLADGQVVLRPGTEVTLNGIAQGYVTDRVAGVLRRRGWPHVMLDVGERMALGRPPTGEPWRLLAPDGTPLRLSGTAAATSAGSGHVFDRAGRHHHLLDPRTGRSAQGHRWVTVLAQAAVLADALSTALAVMTPDAGEGLLRHFPGTRARLLGADGEIRMLGG